MPRKYGLFHELAKPRIWMLFCASLAFLFVSLILEQAFADALGPGAAFLAPKTWVHFLREIGFACFIALVVGFFVERGARHEQAFEAERRQTAIAESVFKGVFATSVPRELVDLAVSAVLRARVVRLSHKNTYTLTGRCHDAGSEPVEYVEFKVTSAYEVRNVSDEEVPFEIRLSFPLPADGRLSALARLLSLTVGGDKYDAARLEAGDAAVPDTAYDKRFAWKRPLAPGETLSIRSEYMMAKEFSDSELWVSVLPNLKMELAMTVNIPDLEFGVRGILPGDVRKVSGTGHDGHHVWEVTSPCLAHQGMSVWWRRRREPRAGRADAIVG